MTLSKPQRNISRARRWYGRKEMKKRKSWIKPRSKKILALYYWGKFLGINPLSLSKKNKMQYSCTSLLYGSCLIMMYCYTYCRLYAERFNLVFPEETPVAVIVDFVGFSCQFLELSSAWFAFSIHQKGVKIIITSFLTAGKTSEKLGIPDDWDKLFKEFASHVLLHNLLYLFSTILSHWMWTYIHHSDPLKWIEFDIPVIASFNTKIIFIWCLILIRRKFRQLNATIKFLMENRHAKSNGMDQRLIRQSRINMVAQLHRELRDLIHHVEGHFAAFVLFSIGDSFTYFTLNVYRMYLYMKGHARQDVQLKYLGAISHWLIFPAAFLVVISNVCGSTSDEANNTGCVLHELLNERKCFHDIREAANFETLSMNLLKNQVVMSLYGLVELDHFLVYRTLATGITHLAIMLQLYN